MKKVLGGLVLFMLLTGSLFGGCAGSSAKTTLFDNKPVKEFLIAGSGSNLAITSELIKQFNKEHNQAIEIPNSIGSGGGIKAVNDGVIHLGLTSRPLNDSEKKLGLKEIPYARIGIVFGVNQDVPDDEITSKDLVDIYYGHKNTWQNGQMIIVLSREKGDSTNLVLEKLVPGFKQALADAFQNRRWQIIYTDQEETEAIASTPDAFGFTDTAALTVRGAAIKPLQIDGVEPIIENIAKGKYKLYKDLRFVYKEPLSGNVQAFLDFVYSDHGRKIISRTGGIPLERQVK